MNFDTSLSPTHTLKQENFQNYFRQDFLLSPLLHGRLGKISTQRDNVPDGFKGMFLLFMWSIIQA